MVITTDAHKYRSIVTDKGKEKIAEAAMNGKKVNITYAAIGDGGGSYYEPSAGMTGLVNEVWSGEIANKKINPESSNMIDVKVILPADVGGFTAREAGLFDSDGDLIVICNMPPIEKVVITTGAAGTLTLIIHVVFTDTDTVEFKINPNLDAASVEDVEHLTEYVKEIQEKLKLLEEQLGKGSKVLIGPADTPLDKGDTLFIVEGMPQAFRAAAFTNVAFGEAPQAGAEYWADMEAGGDSSGAAGVSIINGKMAVSSEQDAPKDAAFLAKL